MAKRHNPLIRGFKLQCNSHHQFYTAWRVRHHYRMTPISFTYEYGASPIRDKGAMMQKIEDMAALGLTYNVFPILRSEVTQ